MFKFNNIDAIQKVIKGVYDKTGRGMSYKYNDTGMIDGTVGYATFDFADIGEIVIHQDADKNIIIDGITYRSIDDAVSAIINASEKKSA